MSLKEIYQKELVPALQKEFGLSNPYEVPEIEKIVLNMGVGKERAKKEDLESAEGDLAKIAGQIPSERGAKKAVASFQIRTGDVVGLSVTLRGERMWDFLEKLIKVVLPRTRDFHGVPKKSFDGHGNYTLGIEEHISFPEIDPLKVNKIRGLEVTIVTDASKDERALKLLEKLGMPFQKQ